MIFLNPISAVTIMMLAGGWSASVVAPPGPAPAAAQTGPTAPNFARTTSTLRSTGMNNA